jgi:hypothetical protein
VSPDFGVNVQLCVPDKQNLVPAGCASIST